MTINGWTQTIAGAVAGALLMATPATAQPAGGGWGPGMMMGPGMMHGRGMWGRSGYGPLCNPQAAGFAEWRIDQIERAVRPNEAQRKALADLRTASTKAAEIVVAACPRDLPASAPARLVAMESRMEAMLQAMKAVRPAFEAFYATLDADQKSRLDAAGPRRWGWEGWRRDR